MNDVTVLLSLFKGHHSTQAIAKGADISRETFRKLERGTQIKLSTLRAIATYLKLSHAQWLALLTAWIKAEVGPDSQHLEIFVHADDSAKGQARRELKTIQELSAQLPAAERQQIILALSRPQVRKCLPLLEQLHHALNPPAPHPRSKKPKAAAKP